MYSASIPRFLCSVGCDFDFFCWFALTCVIDLISSLDWFNLSGLIELVTFFPIVNELVPLHCNVSLYTELYKEELDKTKLVAPWQPSRKRHHLRKVWPLFQSIRQVNLILAAIV